MPAEQNGKIPLKTIFHRFCPCTHGVVRPYVDAPNGTFFMVHAGKEAIVATTVNNIIILRIYRYPGRFPSGGFLPIVLRNGGTIASVIDTEC